MGENKYQTRVAVLSVIWTVLALGLMAVDRLFPGSLQFGSGITVLRFAGILACILALAFLFRLMTLRVLLQRKRPAVEGEMVGSLYNLLAALAIIVTLAYGFGRLGAFGAVFAAFGGMLLGWSLQAPVSGFAAWVLVSLKRPFRPGDRIQFPNLGLTGDVKDVGLMYTVLNQVGGSIGSEEAVGRYILVPNAMLFSQVVINYTVLQESPYMLDEVVIRITYDSDWEEAERILISAATEVTEDIIVTTGTKPYIRSDIYDYGVYLRLRYQTRVNDRVEIAYKITKNIFMDIQRTPSVDLAIPYIYSYRAALEKRDDDGPRPAGIQDIEVSRVQAPAVVLHPDDVEQLAQSIASHGLLQPIVVTEGGQKGFYRIVAGHLRFEACKRLGWKTVPAVVQPRAAGPLRAGVPAVPGPA